MLKVSTKDTWPSTLVLCRNLFNVIVPTCSLLTGRIGYLWSITLPISVKGIFSNGESLHKKHLHLYTQHLNWVCGSFSSIKLSLFVMWYFYKIICWFYCQITHVCSNNLKNENTTLFLNLFLEYLTYNIDKESKRTCIAWKKETFIIACIVLKQSIVYLHILWAMSFISNYSWPSEAA